MSIKSAELEVHKLEEADTKVDDAIDKYFFGDDSSDDSDDSDRDNKEEDNKEEEEEAGDIEEQDEIIIGIDLGTTNSCVGVWRNNNFEIFPDSYGNRTIPSTVAFTNRSK